MPTSGYALLSRLPLSPKTCFGHQPTVIGIKARIHLVTNLPRRKDGFPDSYSPGGVSGKSDTRASAADFHSDDNTLECFEQPDIPDVSDRHSPVLFLTYANRKETLCT